LATTLNSWARTRSMKRRFAACEESCGFLTPP
jgi:hypothetical protein